MMRYATFSLSEDAWAGLQKKKAEVPKFNASKYVASLIVRDAGWVAPCEICGASYSHKLPSCPNCAEIEAKKVLEKDEPKED